MGLIQKLTPGAIYQQKLSPDLGCASQHRGTKIGHEMSPKYWSNFWPRERTEKWNISCYVGKQGYHSHQRFQPSRVLRREKNTCDMARIRLQPLATGSLGELGRWKHRQLTISESWDAHERNDFSQPRLLHLPIYRKALNSLTWDSWFSLIHRNTSDVQTTCPLLQTSTSPESSPMPSWKSSLKATWEATSRIYVLKLSTK